MPLLCSKILKPQKLVLVVGILLTTMFCTSQNFRHRTITELTVDNDIVFRIDRYYSSGVTINVYLDWLKKSPINKILLPSGKKETTYYAMSITHKMFTPERTLTSRIVYKDHPYSSYLLIGGKKISYNLQSRIKKTSTFEIGVIGSLAGGQAIQNELHNKLSIAQESKGWHNQIKNDICLQYGAIFEKGIIHLPVLEVNGFVATTIGIPHTEAQLGGYARVGFFDDYFRGMGIDISPDFNAWFFISGSVYLVNYNATLQGGTINQDNVHTINPINNTLLHGKIGGVIEYRRISAEYGMEVSSPEFSTAWWHRWAHLVIAVAF